MTERCTKCDKQGNEWMTGTQFKAALLQDFEVKCSVTLIYTGMSNGKILSKNLKKVYGKKCINYTQSVVQFLELSPNIAPDKLKDKVLEFRKKQTVEAKKTIPKSIASPAEYSAANDIDISVIEERAKHEKIKRERSEFEFEVIKGNYIEIEHLGVILETIATSTRQAAYAIIPRVRSIAAAESDEHTIDRLLKKELDIALDNLSRLDVSIVTNELLNKEEIKLEVE